MSLSLRVISPLLVVTIKTVINIINIRKIGKGGYFSPVITLMAFPVLDVKISSHPYEHTLSVIDWDINELG